MLKLWDLRSSTSCPLAELSGHTKGVLDLVWNTEDPRFVASTGRDNKILLWDMNKHEILGDITSGEEKPEVPTDAADFFTTVAHAASTTRKTQVLCNRFNHAVIATASYKKKIKMHNVEAVGTKKAVGSNAVYSAVHGYENRFHGKVLSVSDLVCGNDVKEEIGQFESAMASGDLKGFCDRMVTVCEDPRENEMWSFMKVRLPVECDV